MIEFNHAGIINTGFITIFPPYIIGSLILKIEGTINTRPNVFNCFDLEKHINAFKPKVAHIPPIVINAIVNTDSLVTIFVATPPAATASIFA